MDDRSKMQLLRRQHREAIGQIESHLVSEDRQGADTGAIGLFDTMIEYMLDQIEILLHEQLIRG